MSVFKSQASKKVVKKEKVERDGAQYRKSEKEAAAIVPIQVTGGPSGDVIKKGNVNSSGGVTLQVNRFAEWGRRVARTTSVD